MCVNVCVCVCVLVCVQYPGDYLINLCDIFNKNCVISIYIYI